MDKKLTKEEVLHVAKLARLGINDDEVEKLRKELSAVLAFIDKLQEVPVDKVEATSHVGGAASVMREDSRKDIDAKQETKRASSIIKQFPLNKERFLKVLAIFGGKK